jgi:hypothetical protein
MASEFLGMEFAIDSSDEKGVYVDLCRLIVAVSEANLPDDRGIAIWRDATLGDGLVVDFYVETDLWRPTFRVQLSRADDLWRVTSWVMNFYGVQKSQGTPTRRQDSTIDKSAETEPQTESNAPSPDRDESPTPPALRS